MAIVSSVSPVVSMQHARHAHSVGTHSAAFAKMLKPQAQAATQVASSATTATAAGGDGVSQALGGLQHVLDLLQGSGASAPTAVVGTASGAG
ncbi:hypothetical protein [Lichenicola sp.]|uniref:hypothetical protein n=1 Tax=Lichenicola sp. TaxID=2804529 RepID=UPI003B00CA35